LRLFITDTEAEKSVFYGRRETRFIEGKKANFDVGLNCTTLQCDVARDRVDGEFNSILALFNHLVRSCQHIRRDRQTDLLGGFQIDDEVELFRLLHWEIGGLGALQDLST
jgi:hypothetical protein